MKIDTLCAKNALHVEYGAEQRQGKSEKVLSEDLFRNIVIELIETNPDELMALKQSWRNGLAKAQVSQGIIQLCMKAVDIVIEYRKENVEEGGV